MSSSAAQSPQRLKGLDALALTDVLSDATMPRPEVPGWKIGKVLGEGGLGTVWQATRLSDGCVAAVKVPRAEDVTLVERLEVEADVLRALDHPHIVRMLESGSLDNGSLYLAMEFVDGPPLSHSIPAGGFPAARAYAIFRQVAAAVAHAHSRGVLHRDLKPGNILLDPDGNARVADFGLAHSVAGRVLRLSLTLAGQVAGTAEYLPPEAYQRGYEPDTSADVYALGVILHELLTGHPPRGAWQAVSLTKRDVDIRVDDLLRRALEPASQRRFPSAQAMLDELERILRSPGRYSGTPRLTQAVQFMDFLWTLLGGFIFFGALGLATRVEKYGFRLPVDLIGTETMRIGTWQACFVLATAAVPLSLWQLIRLWRFHRVPLREALPAPFGMKPGTTRVSAVAVALAQVLFYAAPTVFAGYAWRDQCTHWLTEEDAPWTQGLIITEGSRGTVAVDPWDWPEEGKEYSLRERSGWINDPLSTQLDHTDFIPGLMPRLLLALVLFSAAAVLLTILSGFARWLRFRKWVPPLFTTFLLLLSAQGVRATLAGLRTTERRLHETLPVNDWTHGTHSRLAHEVLALLWKNTPHTEAAFTPLLHHFAPAARIGDGPLLDHEQLPAALAEYATGFHARHRRLERIFHSPRPWPNLGHFVVPALCEDYTDPPGGPSTGALTVFLAYGGIVPGRGVAIDLLAHHTLPLWTCEPRSLLPDEAAAWARSLLDALNSAADPASFFHPLMLGPASGYQWDPAAATATSARDTIAALRTAVARGACPQLAAPPGPAEPHPGGTQRLYLSITDRGQPATWVADIVFINGGWRCVRLLYTDRRMVN